MRIAPRGIGLCMIVRDEQDVISRCLESVRPFISSWCIVDTGSVDDTPAIVERLLSDIPGDLHHREWRDFGTNRTETIDLASGTADYLLLLDADDELVELDTTLLERRSYNLRVEDGGDGYTQPRLIDAATPWRYVGVTHEYLTSPLCPIPGDTETRGVLRHHCDGSRRPRKFEEDATLLEQSLAASPDDPRTVFYLANTYRDLGRLGEATDLYWQRARMGGWQAEALAAAEQAIRLQSGNLTPVGVPSVA